MQEAANHFWLIGPKSPSLTLNVSNTTKNSYFLEGFFKFKQNHASNLFKTKETNEQNREKSNYLHKLYDNCTKNNGSKNPVNMFRIERKEQVSNKNVKELEENMENLAKINKEKYSLKKKSSFALMTIQKAKGESENYLKIFPSMATISLNSLCKFDQQGFRKKKRSISSIFLSKKLDDNNNKKKI